jgi:hypothetical protein
MVWANLKTKSWNWNQSLVGSLQTDLNWRLLCYQIKIEGPRWVRAHSGWGRGGWGPTVGEGLWWVRAYGGWGPTVGEGPRWVRARWVRAHGGWGPMVGEGLRWVRAYGGWGPTVGEGAVGEGLRWVRAHGGWGPTVGEGSRWVWLMDKPCFLHLGTRSIPGTFKDSCLPYSRFCFLCGS